MPGILSLKPRSQQRAYRTGPTATAVKHTSAVREGQLRITCREQLAMLTATPFAMGTADGTMSYPKIAVFEAA